MQNTSTKTVSLYPLPKWLWQLGLVYMSITLVTYIGAFPIRYRDLLQIQPVSIATLQIAIEYISITILFFIGGLLVFKRSTERIAVLTGITLPAGIFNLATLSFLSVQIHPIFYVACGIVFIPMTSFVFLFLISVPDGNAKPRWLIRLIPPFLVYDTARYLIFFVFGSAQIQTLRPIVFLINLLFGLLGGVVMIHRYRYRSTPIQRQQFKWLFLGLNISLSLVALIQTFRFITLRFGGTAPLNSLFGSIILSGAGILIGVSILLAIFRYGLWDVDLTVNRSLVTFIVTLILTMLFGVLFLTTQLVLQKILGNVQNELAIGISALIIGGTFNPIRLRVRHFVDRRLYGFRFDLNQLERHKEEIDIQNPGALTGLSLGGYELLDVIGRGGMGEVYKGFGNGKQVAIKVLQNEYLFDKKTHQRFRREGEITLNHPHIVKTIGGGEENNLVYIIMEYVEGKTLKEVIAEQHTISLEDIRDYFSNLAGAIDYAHAQGYIHRDIKPSNIMLCLNPDNETYKAMLMDFGVAKFLDNSSSLTGSSAVGTIDYMAPEQIKDSTTVDFRADIYALGVVVYQTLSGTLPFKGSLAQVLFAHVNQPAPDIRQLRPDLSLSVSIAIQRALMKDPDDRFQSATEFIKAINLES